MIRVCDAIMGSGKSSAAITYMNEHADKHYIYIAPYLDEATRIKEACPNLDFVEPSKTIPEFRFSKTRHTLKLLKDGRNVATTHQAFSYYTEETLALIREKKYILIIDESVEVLDDVDCTPSDLNTLVRAGYVSELDGEYKLVDDSYSTGLYSNMFRLMKSRNIIKNAGVGDGKLLYWILPPDLIESFEDVYVLTYLFDGQDIHHLVSLYNIPYQFIGVARCNDGAYRFCDGASCMPEYVKTLSNRIHILDNKKLNSIGDDRYALSMNWFSKSVCVETLKRNIYNYFRNIIGDDRTDERMWATYDKCEYKLRGKGYSTKFVIFNEKATNLYRDRKVLVYAVNLFMNAGQKHFYQSRGIEVSDDMYALSNMIQWIWRSAIRDGDEIEIYIPSRRMRELLINWIADVERRYGELMEGGERVCEEGRIL